MSEQNKALIRRWFEEVWNKGREDAIDEMFSENGIAYGLADSGPHLRGPDGFKPFFRAFKNAFPDLEVIVEDVIGEGDKVVARCSVRGRHTGNDLGFDATHQPIEITGMTIVRIENGKIVEGWNNFDFMKLYQQLGAIQPPATKS